MDAKHDYSQRDNTIDRQKPARFRLSHEGTRYGRLLLLGALVSVFALTTGSFGGEDRQVAGVAERLDVDSLIARATEAGRALEQVHGYYEQEVEPIERVLVRYRNDPALARQISLALVREGQKVRVDPRVLMAVLLVENPWLDPSARSFVGARGLMQVMPLHQGNWGCPGNMDDVDVNICYGARIFANYFRQEKGDVERALLRYNGCVRGTNTPDCHKYPYHVYARAGRASILAWLQPQPARAAAP